MTDVLAYLLQRHVDVLVGIIRNLQQAALTVEIVKACDGVYKAVDIVAIGGGPLETVAEEHLGGVLFSVSIQRIWWVVLRL